MANATLFRSSVGLGVAHCLGVALWGTDLVLVTLYLVGVLTSLLNHGLHQEAGMLNHLRTADRAWMLLGTAIDVWYIAHLPRVPALVASSCVCVYSVSFLLAKTMVHGTGKTHAGNLPHMVTHIGATILHVWLLHITSDYGGKLTVQLPHQLLQLVTK